MLLLPFRFMPAASPAGADSTARYFIPSSQTIPEMSIAPERTKKATVIFQRPADQSEQWRRNGVPERVDNVNVQGEGCRSHFRGRRHLRARRLMGLC